VGLAAAFIGPAIWFNTSARRMLLVGRALEGVDVRLAASALLIFCVGLACVSLGRSELSEWLVIPVALTGLLALAAGFCGLAFVGGTGRRSKLSGGLASSTTISTSPSCPTST